MTCYKYSIVFVHGTTISGVGSGKRSVLPLNLGLFTKADIKDLDGNPDITYTLSISTKSNIQDEHIFNIKSEVKKWLTKRINVFGLYKHEYYNEKEDFQFKVGLGVKL